MSATRSNTWSLTTLDWIRWQDYAQSRNYTDSFWIAETRKKKSKILHLTTTLPFQVTQASLSTRYISLIQALLPLPDYAMSLINLTCSRYDHANCAFSSTCRCTNPHQTATLPNSSANISAKSDKNLLLAFWHAYTKMQMGNLASGG